MKWEIVLLRVLGLFVSTRRKIPKRLATNSRCFAIEHET